MASGQCECCYVGCRVGNDLDSCWFHNLKAGHFVREVPISRLNLNFVTDFQLLNVSKWSVVCTAVSGNGCIAKCANHWSSRIVAGPNL